MHEDNNLIGIWILYAFASAVLWIVLVFLKLLGVVRISWIGVVLGLFWIPLVLMGIICGVAALVILIAHIKRRHRRKVTDRRIIRQAKAIGAWTPQVAGGKCLDNLAHIHGLDRQQGESDADLRKRILEFIERKHLDETAARFGIKRKNGETNEQFRSRASAELDELINSEMSKRSGNDGL